ncbi:MAG: hypothetical protein Q4C96_05510 [Planctomycetia bacterium]|nr:hypothetical protein [Planctomycetia bacterium]
MNIFYKNFYSQIFSIILFLSVIFYGEKSHSSQDIWFIDLQCVSWNCASCSNFEKISYFQLDDEGKWRHSDAVTFYETVSPDIPLIFFTPGYTSTSEDTVNAGMNLARLCGNEHPYRLVLWNWPAKRVYPGLAEDIRAKIPVAAASGLYMAMFLKKLPPKSQVSLYSFSFGARVVCDAVESLGDSRPEGMRISLVLSAAATDYFWLSENGRHLNVPRLIDRALILCNMHDRALRFYPLLYGDGSRPDALGRFGAPRCAISPEYRGKFESVDVGIYVGAQHKTQLHMDTPAFRQRIGKYLFFDETILPVSACEPVRGTENL